MSLVDGLRAIAAMGVVCVHANGVLFASSTGHDFASVC